MDSRWRIAAYHLVSGASGNVGPVLVEVAGPACVSRISFAFSPAVFMI
jgi:hypothetical protein